MKHRERGIDYNRENLISDLVYEAKSTNLHSDAAFAIAKLVADDVEKWLESRTMITDEDYKHKIVEKIGKYSTDLAYIYLNRDKII